MQERYTLVSGTRLYLIRHGRTDWNALRIIQGEIERDLDTEGRRQVEEAAARFRDIPLKAIYTSVMARAQQTAQIIADTKGLTIHPLQGLHEGSYGFYEGTPIPDFEKKFADKFAERNRLSFEEQLRFPLGEGIDTAQDILNRVLPLLHDLCRKHLGEHVLIVTHGWVIRTLVSFLRKENLDGIRIRNGGHVVLEGDGESFQVIDYEEALL